MFIPHTDSERDEMLKTIGIEKMEELFDSIPKKYRFPKLNLPEGLAEMEAMAELQSLSWENESLQELVCFLGAGAYNHYIPAAVDSIIRRGEFFTAYTPYQPEISQGTLQVIFEYQSMITALTGMESSNASHYDGASAAAEAVSMADVHFRGKRTKIILSPSVHPQYRETIRTYHHNSNLKFVGDSKDTNLLEDPDLLESLIDENTALVLVQYPDFFGRINDFTKLVDKTHSSGALFAVSTNPISLALFSPPGDFGADIVTGEGQPLGIPISYGGPYLGFFATRMEYVRKMAGRIVGQTVDNRGQKAYVLTLTAREQHIRRDKATSNICTNQGLIALAATVYMSLLGKQGLREVSELCFQKAHYAAKTISQIKGYKLWSSTPFFNEFVVECPLPVARINQFLLEYGILGGYDLSAEYTNLDNHMLIAVTEMNSKDEIDTFSELLAEVAND